MFEKFARSARAAVEDAKYEVGRRGDRRIGTEHLLIALLQDDVLAGAVGADSERARETMDALDHAALAAVGVELGAYRPRIQVALGRLVPLTAGAKSIIRGALANAAREKSRTITSRHVMLALLDRNEPDPAAALLAALDVDQVALRDRLAAA